MVKLSVIVPVYKVEKYLKECVESIINQTFTDFELILVDDGSPDNSGKMCDELALQDERIKVIHKENGGLSSARNAALDIVKGKYICFIDSDDLISIDMFKSLYNALQQNKAKIAVGKFKTFFDRNEININNKGNFESKLISAKEMIILAITDNLITFSVCNKMFETSLWEGIRFKEKIHYEDEDITYKIFDVAGTCILCDVELYFYRMNNESITKKISPKIIDQYYTRKYMYEFISQKYNDIAPLCYVYWFNASIDIYLKFKCVLHENMENYKFLLKFDKNILRNINSKLLTKDINKKVNLYLILPSEIMIFYIRVSSKIKRILKI